MHLIVKCKLQRKEVNSSNLLHNDIVAKFVSASTEVLRTIRLLMQYLTSGHNWSKSIVCTVR
jgi:hypothetical protein